MDASRLPASTVTSAMFKYSHWHSEGVTSRTLEMWIGCITAEIKSPSGPYRDPNCSELLEQQSYVGGQQPHDDTPSATSGRGDLVPVDFNSSPRRIAIQSGIPGRICDMFTVV